MRVLGLAGVGVLLGWLAPLGAGQTAATEPLTWRVSEQQAVELWLQGQRHATTPSEGLWSIGTGWKDGWPAEWQHARPTQREVVNEWTLLSGSLAFAGGELLLRDGDVLRFGPPDQPALPELVFQRQRLLELARDLRRQS